jgi:hypothetical protein
MPYPPLSRQLEVHHTYISDVYDVAHYIHNTLEPVAHPLDAGLYLPGQLDPVLRADREYWYQEPVAVNQAHQSVAVRDNDAYNPTPWYHGDATRSHNQPWQYYRYNYIRVQNLEQALSTPWDVVEMPHNFIPPYFNKNDAFPGSDEQPRRVVLPAHLAHQATLKPTLPVMGLKLAKAMIENEITSSRSFNQLPAKTIEELVLPFIDEQFLPNHPTRVDSVQTLSLEYLRNDPWFQRQLNGIYDSMQLVLEPVRHMLRANPFLMFTVNYQDGFNIRIDQLGDYRIHEWERLVNDPEYQRWQRARADGSWDRFTGEQDENKSRAYTYEPHHYPR